MKKLLLQLGAALLAATTTLAVHAGPYTSITVFGDSLSDTGNVFVASGGTQPPPGQPYFSGRFSNGPVWVETLATDLGRASDVVPALLGGSNYAFAGARTAASGAVPSVLAQIGGMWAPTHPTADPNGLYVVVGGGNDMRDARGPASTPASRQAAAETAATNLFHGVALLASRGARHVLLSNLADLGATPEAMLLGLTANSTDVTLRFNALIAGLEGTLEATFPGLQVDVVDLFGLGAAVVDDALNNGAAYYGISNVVAPCAGFFGSSGASCAVSLFSDALHPSARAHALLGHIAAELVLPLPGTLALLALGLVAAGAARRKAQR